MWHNIQDKTPEKQTAYPVWVRATHSRHEFWHTCVWVKRENGFVIDGTFRTPEEYGWEVIAWFDLPEYRR